MSVKVNKELKSKILFIIICLLAIGNYQWSMADGQSCSTARHPRHAKSLARRAPAARRASLYTGQKRQLVLLAAFSDLQFKSNNPLLLWNNIFNQPQFQDIPFQGSVHDYFNDQSYGLFDLQFDLYYVQVDQKASVYRSIGTDDSGAGLLLMDLIAAMGDEVEDWTVYDWNDDRYVDQVFILFAGYGQNDGGSSQTIWPHQWNLHEQGREPLTVGQSLKVDNYACFPELSGRGDYGSFGTLCHEYGHCLGLPDFYYGSHKVVGNWDIMDYGNYNNGGYCPAGYSAHERMVLGWLTPTELTEPISISGMPPLTSDPVAYLVRNDGYAEEYYILENRQQQGWDKHLPGSGLLIFHVDYDEKEWMTGFPNNKEVERYTIIPANGAPYYSYQEGWAWPQGTRDSLTNISVPYAKLLHDNIDGSRLLSKPITHIAVTDGLASFSFMGGTATSITELPMPNSQRLYSFGPIYIIRYPNGQVKKVMKGITESYTSH